MPRSEDIGRIETQTPVGAAAIKPHSEINITFCINRCHLFPVTAWGYVTQRSWLARLVLCNTPSLHIKAVGQLPDPQIPTMCRVTRVTNSCGHVNDHVDMVCHFAKPISPERTVCVLADRTNQTIQRNASPPRYQDPTKLARPIPARPARYVKVHCYHYSNAEDIANGIPSVTADPSCHLQPMTKKMSMTAFMLPRCHIASTLSHGSWPSHCLTSWRNTSAW